MSYAATYNAFQVSGISKAEQHVLTAVCTFANQHGVCWPSVETIAARCLSSARTVQTHLNGLVKAGLIQRTMRAGRSAMLRVMVPTPATSAPPPPQLLHPEPAIEPVNTIPAAPPPEPLPAAADAAIVVYEQIPEQPKTAIEPSQDVGGTVALAEAVQEPVEATIDPLAAVPETLMKDLGEVRKAKKRPAKPTKTEAALWWAEAQKAGWTMQQVITTMILHGWARFQADWVQHVPPQTAPGASAPSKVWQPEPHTPASAGTLAKMREQIAQMKARWREEPLKAPPIRR